MSAAVLSPLMGASGSLMCLNPHNRNADDDSDMEEDDDLSIPSLSIEASAMTEDDHENDHDVTTTLLTTKDDNHVNNNNQITQQQQEDQNDDDEINDNNNDNDDSMSVDEEVSSNNDNADATTTELTTPATVDKPEAKENEEEKKEDDTIVTRTIFTQSEKQQQKDPSTSLFPHGGLTNLGNTCYLNSALQMLASLDCFVPDLLDNEDSVVEPELRQAVVNLFQQLKDNTKDSSTIVDPSDLKQIIDDKTPLFIGYRQQDSHEFLTTLLDLLDEDYKPKKKPTSSESEEEKQEETEDNNQDSSSERDQDEEEGEEGGEDKMDTSGETTNEQQDDTNFEAVQEKDVDENTEQQQQQQQEEPSLQESSLPQNEEENNNDDHNNDDNNNMDTTEDSLPKKPRTEETMDHSPIVAPIRHIQSLSELQPDDISQLLHGDTSSSTATTTNSQGASAKSLLPHQGSTNDEEGATTMTTATGSSNPHKRKTEQCCKLVGGRAVLPNNDTTMVELKQQDSSSLSKDSENDIANSNSSSPACACTDNSMSNNSNDDTTTQQQQQEGEQEEESTPPPSPIDIAFTTQIRARLTCDSCKYTRTHIETYKHLSLDIITDDTSDTTDSSSTINHSTIEEGLRKFFANESRDLKCEKCFFEKATFQKEIVQLPKALLLHLKRFIVNVSDDWTRITYEKNQSNVEFPQELSILDSAESDNDCEYTCCDVLKESLDPSTVIVPTLPTSASSTTTTKSPPTPKYRIRSVVNHIGNSASCGHYTADGFVKTSSLPIKGGEQRSWKRFNDSMVSDISHQDACEKTQKTAYMIMYELQ